MLRLAHRLPACATLGPGTRGVLWVAGCTRGCPGCVAGPILGPEAGDLVSVEALASELLGWTDIEGLTLSGGEPFEQAGALADLLDRVVPATGWSVMVYTGYLHAELRVSCEKDVQRLLAHTDLLVDGPFVLAQQADRLWRGSSNQRLHALTSRYRDLVADAPDHGVGVEVHLRSTGQVFWAGVPVPGFEARLRRELSARGVVLERQEGGFA